VNIRVDYLQGQHLGQCRRTAFTLSVNANLKALSAIAGPDTRNVPGVLNPPEKNKLLFSVPNQVGG
jgi:hypothetical protein